MDNTAYVDLQISGKLATIEFFHPAHNSLPSDILSKLAKTIESLNKNSEVSVILLKSGGDRTFCAGASFDELASIEDFETGETFFMGFANVINACRKSNKLIVGRVQGKAVGGGVGVASAVDYCIATIFASVKLSELNVGIGPFVVGPAVERKMGLSAMSELTINASEWRTAEWAQSRGLFCEVFKSAEQMDEYIETFTKRLCEYNPEAISEIKKVLWEGTENWDRLLSDRAKISGKLVLSDFTKNAIAKFKAKA